MAPKKKDLNSFQFHPDPMQSDLFDNQQIIPFPTGKAEPQEADQVTDYESRKAAYEARKAAKIERYSELSEKKARESDQQYKESKRMTDAIPFGQPILVGHHSEKRDRNYRDKAWNKMGKAVKLQETSGYYAEKAERLEKDNTIKSEDPDALQKLEDKLASMLKSRESMKQANKIIRSKKTTEPEKIKLLIAHGYSESDAADLLVPNCFNELGFPSYSFRNLSGNIKRVKERIEEQKRVEEIANQIKDDIIINGVVICWNTIEGRVQMEFPQKPSKEFWSKHLRGWNYSRRNQCHQKALKPYNLRQAKEIAQLWDESPIDEAQAQAKEDLKEITKDAPNGSIIICGIS